MRLLAFKTCCLKLIMNVNQAMFMLIFQIMFRLFIWICVTWERFWLRIHRSYRCFGSISVIEWLLFITPNYHKSIKWKKKKSSISVKWALTKFTKMEIRSTFLAEASCYEEESNHMDNFMRVNMNFVNKMIFTHIRVKQQAKVNFQP